MNCFSPYELVEIAEHTAAKKSHNSFLQFLVLGFFGGAYIAIGGLLTICICGYLWTDVNPGFVKFMAGSLFGVGLILVSLLGAELFTGNTSYFMPPVLSKTLKVGALLKNWTFVYLTNFCGALFIAYVIAYKGEILSETQVEYLSKYAYGKVYQDFIPAFIKGIACNWLVSAAMWITMAAKDVAGKIIGLWFPIMAFVAMGMEHSIANQFFIPLAIFEGSDILWTDFFVKNLLPVTLGNIVGGAIFVGGFYWLAYGKKHNENKKN